MSTLHPPGPIRARALARTLPLTLLLALSACGGGGGGGGEAVDTAATLTVPPGATVSAEAFSAYAGSAAPDDRAEPLDLDGVVVPGSDTAEPVELR